MQKIANQTDLELTVGTELQLLEQHRFQSE